MSTEIQSLSGTISMEEFSKGSRSESIRPALTADDGSVLFIRVIGANPFHDDAVNAAVSRIQNEADGHIENLEGRVHNGTLFVKDVGTLLKAAGLVPETMNQSQSR